MNDRHFLFKNEIPSKTRATKHETRNSHTGLHESFIDHDLFVNSGFLKNILSLRDSTTDTFWAESACTLKKISLHILHVEYKNGRYPHFAVAAVIAARTIPESFIRLAALT